MDLYAGMNKTERRRAIELEAKRRAGEIASWRFEAVTLKLADDCRYTPDFLVIETDGAMRFEEIKGHWRDDAKVKIRVAAKQFPEFYWRALEAQKGGGFRVVDFSAGTTVPITLTEGWGV